MLDLCEAKVVSCVFISTTLVGCDIGCEDSDLLLSSTFSRSEILLFVGSTFDVDKECLKWGEGKIFLILIEL